MKTIGTPFLEFLLFISVSFLVPFVSGCRLCPKRDRAETRSNKEEEYIDPFTQLVITPYPEKMPQYKKDTANFILELVENLSPQEEDLLSRPTHIVCVFVIDTTGALVGPRIEGKNVNDCSLFENNLLNTVSSMQFWTRGYKNDVPINTLITCPIYLDYRE